uniref:ATP-dependent Clp protease proteolytic subunit n=2 Tax=Astragalus TaxID=20400 RepID=A0A8K1JEY8_9FABA|nr:clp protease proteolytic subunit [Astragalus gypsodes]AJE72753.1 ATP-dependent Clp protease proteolytic subunit [Astragalus crassicarpus]UCS40608.1 clp protease proteolytic subunit [Astragalus gypsodes]
MPVGVPKVPYLVPDDDDASWLDLYNRLYQERLLFLGVEINSETANQLAGLMIYLSIEDPTREIFMFINSPGGDIISGLGLYDTMHFVGAEVNTVAFGLVASMASVILVGGEITKRLAFPHARVLMHQPASSFLDAKTGEGMLDAFELMKIRDNIIDIYTRRTNKPSWQIDYDLERDRLMSAEEAKDYGIVDMVAEGG